MKLDDFIRGFCFGNYAIFIEQGEQFKAICNELERRGYRIFETCSFEGTLYQYAMDRLEIGYTCLIMFKEGKDSTIEVTAATYSWMPKVVSAKEIESPAEAELLALIGGAA